MAKIVGCAAMSHAPQLVIPPEDWLEIPNRTKRPVSPRPELENFLTAEARRANFDRCHQALGKIKNLIKAWKPDMLIVVGDDQHENLFDDNMPPFVIYTSDEVLVTRKMRHSGETPLQQAVKYPVSKSSAESLLTSLMDHGFDPAWSRSTRYEAGLGHAFGRALYLVMPEVVAPILPVMVNTYYPPAPSAQRCLDFGKAMRMVIDSWPEDTRVAILSSGGLSHTIIDEKFDADLISALKTNDEKHLGSISADILIEGTSEVRNWIIAAGIAQTRAEIIDYVPCYRSVQGTGCAMGFASWQVQ